MAAVALGRRCAKRLEVVGSYGAVSHAVGHVALLAADAELGPATGTSVYQMGKRLEIDPPTSMNVDAVAWLPLSATEEQQIDVWLDDMKTRTARCTYLAFPDAGTRADPITGNVTGFTFSCAGFVRTAYRDGAGLDLTGPQGTWPEVDAATVRAVWAIPVDAERRVLDFVGLSGPGPWRILLPGYLMHALSVGRYRLPYTPSPTDVSFP